MSVPCGPPRRFIGVTTGSAGKDRCRSLEVRRAARWQIKDDQFELQLLQYRCLTVRYPLISASPPWSASTRPSLPAANVAIAASQKTAKQHPTSQTSDETYLSKTNVSSIVFHYVIANSFSNKVKDMDKWLEALRT